MVSRPTPDDRVEVEYVDGSRKRVRRSRLAELGKHWRVVTAEQPEQAAAEEAAPPEPPQASAVKADWVAHAKALGATDAEVEGMTKAQLLTAYGPQDEPGDDPGEDDEAPREG